MANTLHFQISRPVLPNLDTGDILVDAGQMGQARWIFALGLDWRPEGFSEGKPEAVGRGFAWEKSQVPSIYSEGTNSPGYPQGFSTDCHSK